MDMYNDHYYSIFNPKLSVKSIFFINYRET